MSQSPQTGQFNSYLGNSLEKEKEEVKSLNPLKRVNSILTKDAGELMIITKECLNPLKRVNSILTKD